MLRSRAEQELDAWRKKKDEQLHAWLRERNLRMRDQLAVKRSERRMRAAEQRAERREARAKAKREVAALMAAIEHEKAEADRKVKEQQEIEAWNRAGWQATLEAHDTEVGKAFEQESFGELYDRDHYEPIVVALDFERSEVASAGPQFDDYRDLINDHRTDGRGVTPGEALQYARHAHTVERDLTPQQRAERHAEYLRAREAAERDGWER